MNYQEDEVGLIWCCRLKSSWTPLESKPHFDITDTSEIVRKDDYQKVEPHAFVHFARPESASCAMDKAGQCELLLKDKVLRARLGPGNLFRSNNRRRDVDPFKFSDVLVEIGSWFDREMFFVGWRGPPSGVDFLVDPFDGTCRFCFTRETAFRFKSVDKCAIINCNFKIDFLVRDIHEIKQYRDSSSLVLMLQLTSSPRVCYRTADDNIEESFPFEMMDDDDPWIKTTDITPSGAIGRCNSYRVSIRPHHGLKLQNAIKHLKERRVQEDTIKYNLKVGDEPEFGTPVSILHFRFITRKGYRSKYFSW